MFALSRGSSMSASMKENTASEANSELEAAASRLPSVLEPEFLRPADVHKRYGIKRGLLYRAMASGKVRSVVLRERGKVRGARLVFHDSLRSWILSHEVTPSA